MQRSFTMISFHTERPNTQKKTLIEKCHTALSSPAHARTCSNVPKAASSVSVGRTERTAIQSNGCKHLWNFRHSALWWVDSPNALANGQTSQNTKDPSYEQQGTQRNHGDMNLESKTAAGKLTSVKLKLTLFARIQPPKSPVCFHFNVSHHSQKPTCVLSM